MQTPLSLGSCWQVVAADLADLAEVSRPEKVYFRSIMSWIDIFAVLPYFVTLSIPTNHFSSFDFARVVRLCRVFRLFIAISKQSRMLSEMAIVLEDSMEEFKTLFICNIISN